MRILVGCHGKKCLIALSLLTLISPLPTIADSRDPISYSKAGPLLGQAAQDSDGEEIGKLRDFVVNMRAGQLKYVIIDSGGFLGVRSQTRAVPSHIFSAATAKKNVVAIDIDGPRWQKAPTLKRSQLPKISANQARDIAHFYEHRPAHTLAGTSTNGSAQLTPTSHESTTPAQLSLVSDLFGKNVVNQQKEKIGEVRDLLLPPHGTSSDPVFVIVSAGRLFRKRESPWAIPLSAFSTSSDGSKLVINISREALERAKPFEDAAAHADGGVIFRYDESRQNRPQSSPRKDRKPPSDQ